MSLIGGVIYAENHQFSCTITAEHPSVVDIQCVQHLFLIATSW